VNVYVNLVAKIFAAALASLMGQMVIGFLLFLAFGQVWENQPGLSETILPLAACTLLTVLALVFPVQRSSLSGGALFLALFLAVFGLNVFLVQIEAVVFLAMTTGQFWSGAIHAALSALWLSWLMVVLFAHEMPAGSTATDGLFTARNWLNRIALSALCYVVLYLTAGILILPFVEDFYETQDMALGAWFLPLQFVRGTLYVAFVLPLLRSIRAPRWHTALSMAFMFPILAGAAGLLIPNPIMPESVRYWHMLEIGWSNMVYGFLVGHLFWKASESANTFARRAPA